jgi:class 3 adenylate cyclase
MKSAPNQPTQPIHYKLAHINYQGIDLIIIPLEPSFGKINPKDQIEITKTLQHHASSAGLKGQVVPVWDTGGGMAGFLAEKQLHAFFQKMDYAFLMSHLNRELVIRGHEVIQQTTPIVPDTDTPGRLTVQSEFSNGQLFIDGAFTANLPAELDLPPGNHLLEIKTPGYLNFIKQINLKSGDHLRLAPVLELEEISPPASAALSPLSDLEAALDGRAKVAEFQRKHRTGLITLMFTDMVESTQLKQDLGDRDAVLLIQRHHAAVRRLLTQFSTADEISTAGDSFFLVFAKPSDAVKFALLLHLELRALASETGRTLMDRIGIHVGEVFIEEQNVNSPRPKDLYGIQVDTCARIMSLGTASQILMTRFAFDNARQVLKGEAVMNIEELYWVNHGYYSLKGVEEPIEICEVGEAGFSAFKPPANSDKCERVGSCAVPGSTPASPHVVISSSPRARITSSVPRNGSPQLPGASSWS